MTDLEVYYVTQAGSGIAGYHGLKYQRGHGFFGRILRGIILPFLKTAGKKAAAEGIGLAEDLMSGRNFKETAKRRGKSLLKSVAQDAIDLAKAKMAARQQGSGLFTAIAPVRRKRKPRKRTSKKRKSVRKSAGKRKVVSRKRKSRPSKSAVKRKAPRRRKGPRRKKAKQASKKKRRKAQNSLLNFKF